MSLNKEKLEKRFREEYERLNEKQRLAVDTIEGPVMVIAGPGTGKTQILASRIGKILLETDALPQNILCLTYTEAGVVAMRRRLLGFIGPDAYKVNIHTFHAFCNDVIQENLSYFEKTALDAISELERIQLFKELIDSFQKNHPLKRYRGDVYFEIRNLQSLFSTMKREGWTPAFINERVNAYIDDLPNREEFVYKRKYKEFNAGDLKKDKIEEEKEKMEKLRAAVNEFDRFQELMRKKNRYDFDDMINWVIRAFRENKNLLVNYQERFQYILVDEYQDTSGTQNSLVELLINYWERPNVFVVGDDDQSIYRFQGANVENMLQFAHTYKDDLLTVVLTHNYRSIQPILDISKTLINRNEERLVRQLPNLSKELIASNLKINTFLHAPVIKEYQTTKDEMIGIVKQVQQLILQEVKPGRIGVIYKENKYGEELAQYFKLLQITVYSKRHLNMLEMPLAKKIILVLKYLVAEHDVPYAGDEMLFEILHFDWFGIPPIEIAKLSIETADKKYSDQTSMRRQLIEKSAMLPKDLFTPSIHEGLKKASGILEGLIGDVHNITLQQLFDAIIRKAGVLTKIMQSADKHWQLQVLTGFFEFVKEETHRDPSLTLKQLVRIIELMESEGIALPLVQISGSDGGVNLMTAHGSKGLEFEYVFVAGTNSSVWEKKRKPGGGYSLPDTMLASPATSASAKEGTEELRRLFYVALTRAEQYLTISYVKFRPDGNELEPSIFIAEIMDQHPSLTPEKVIVDIDVTAEFAVLHFGDGEAPEIERLEEELMNRLLESFVMHVSALNNYLNCPLEFYFRNLVRIPSPRNENTEFGSAVHYALEHLFRKMQEGGKDQFPSKDEFIAFFNWYMHRHRESFTPEQFNRRAEYGIEVLSNYYDKYIHQFNKIVAIERNIRNVVIHGIPLKGKLDKLEFDGKSVNIVDYKTGDPDKGRSRMQPPNEKSPNGGDYWRQAIFYKILIDNYEQKDWKVASTEFDFIEPDKKKVYRREKIIIRPEDTTTVTQQIITVWQKIQNREFYVGCGKEDCHWCNFVKTNNLAVALHEIEEEE
jgi:DNA helicase-2/ATP-dependent DNA helicase PcrA